MSANPTSLDKLIRALQVSELVAPGDIKNHLEAFRASAGTSAKEVETREFAKYLVKQEVLTEWQAKKLLDGKKRGFRLGRYKLLAVIGKGGMGTVFLAEHTVMEHRVAIKILPQEKFRRSSYLDRFKREAKAAAALDHPNIVRAYDIDTEKVGDVELNFIVMEYVDGANLYEIVKRRGPLSPLEAIHYLRQAAEGLAHAHKAKLIHRDIKPDNLLLDRHGTIKLLDLGLARFTNEEENSLTVEHNDKVIGTADYLAPEQAVDSHTVDHRADIYALGCTLYFLLVGKPPFCEGSMAQRLIAHQTKEPPKLNESRKDVPRSLEQLLTRLMAKKPEDRPQTAEEVSDLFADWLAQNVGATPSAVLPSPSMVIGAGTGSMGSDSAMQSNFAGVLSGVVSSNVLAGTKVMQLVKDQPKLGISIIGGGIALLTLAAIAISSFFTDEEPIVASTESAIPAVSTPDLVNEDSLLPAQNTAAVASTKIAPQPVADASIDAPSPAMDSPKQSGANNAGLAKATTTPPVTWDPLPSIADRSPITVGPNGTFSTITAALEHVHATFAPVDETERQVVELEAGAVFRESIVLIRGRELKFPQYVTIQTDPKNPAHVIGTGSKPALTLKYIDDLSIKHVVFDANKADYGLQINGFARAVDLEGIKVRNFDKVGIYLEEATGVYVRPFRLIDVKLLGSATDQVAILFNNSERMPAAVELTGCHFVGPFEDGLQIRCSPTGFTLRHNIFDDMKSAVHFVGDDLTVSKFQVINNTFHSVANGILMDKLPSATSERMALAKNLFSETQLEFSVAEGADAAGMQVLFDEGGWIAENFSTRPAPKNPLSEEFPIVKPRGFTLKDARFISTDPTDANYMRPGEPLLHTTEFGNDPKYIGAIDGK